MIVNHLRTTFVQYSLCTAKSISLKSVNLSLSSCGRCSITEKSTNKPSLILIPHHRTNLTQLHPREQTSSLTTSTLRSPKNSPQRNPSNPQSAEDKKLTSKNHPEQNPYPPPPHRTSNPITSPQQPNPPPSHPKNRKTRIDVLSRMELRLGRVELYVSGAGAGGARAGYTHSQRSPRGKASLLFSLTSVRRLPLYTRSHDELETAAATACVRVVVVRGVVEEAPPAREKD